MQTEYYIYIRVDRFSASQHPGFFTYVVFNIEAWTVDVCISSSVCAQEAIEEINNKDCFLFLA